MSILDGLLSPALTVATQAAGTYENAQADAKAQAVKAAIQNAQLKRQADQDRIKAVIEERQAKQDAIKAQLLERQLSQPMAPVRGTPEYLKALDAEERIKARHSPPREPKEPNYQVIQTDQGMLHVNPQTGETRTLQGPNGQSLQKPQAPQQKKAIATNIGTVRRIDSALSALSAHPDAVGFTRGRIDALDQVLDKDGVDARALIANIGSQIVHDRSGAAVTISEYPRLAPFIPSISDTPEAVVKKLKQLREAITLETELLGGSMDTPSSAPAQRQSGLKQKYGLE